MTDVNWPAVGVGVTVLIAIVGGVFALARMIFTANRDTSVPAESLAAIQQQLAELQQSRFEDRIAELERQLQSSRDRELDLQRKVWEQGREIDSLRSELAEYKRGKP